MPSTETMMKCERLVLLLLAFLLYAALSASPAHADRVDDYVREQMRLRHIPGLAIVVMRDGRVIKESGYGLASVELDVPVSSSTVFEIGSISKQITAAAVMMLVEEGKVSLNDPISKYIWNDIAVRQPAKQAFRCEPVPQNSSMRTTAAEWGVDAGTL